MKAHRRNKRGDGIKKITINEFNAVGNAVSFRIASGNRERFIT